MWATVDGTLSATCLRSGQQLWQVSLPQGQQVFADLLLLQPLSRSVPQAARAPLSADDSAAGVELLVEPPLQQQQQQQQGLSKAGAGVQEQGQQVPGSSSVGVLVATKSGAVFVLNVSSGAQVKSSPPLDSQPEVCVGGGHRPVMFAGCWDSSWSLIFVPCQ